MAFANRIVNHLKKSVTVSPALNQAIRCMSSSKLFIGGLSYGTDDQSLREAFTSYGEVVEARVIMDRETGRSRGFGFVTFTSSEEASAAIGGMDGKDLHGRVVRVNYAMERTGGFRGGYGGGGYGAGGGGYGGGGGGYSGSGYGGDYSSGGGYGGGGGYNSGPGGGGGGYSGSGYGGGYSGGVGYNGGGYNSEPGGGGSHHGGSGIGGGTSAGGNHGVAGGGGGVGSYGGGSGGYEGSSGVDGGGAGGYGGSGSTGVDSNQYSRNFSNNGGYVNDNQDLLEDDFKDDDDDEPNDYANKRG